MKPDLAPTADSPASLTKTLKSAGRICARYATGKLSAAFYRLLGSRANGTFAILVYHRCVPRVSGARQPSMNVLPERFRSQLSGLKKLGYAASPLGRVIDACRRGEPLPPKTLVITFDDGFESVYRWAWPILCELEMPAVVFLNTAYLDQQAPFPFDGWGRRNRTLAPAETYRPLSTSQCAEMLHGGLIELGAHTHTHSDFRGRPGELRRDLEICLKELRERFGLEDAPFAFPFGKSRLGHVDHTLTDAVRRTGVSCALTTDGKTVRMGDDPMGWGRFNVYDFDTPHVLAAKCEGWHNWLVHLQAWTPMSRRTRRTAPSGQTLVAERGTHR